MYFYAQHFSERSGAWMVEGGQYTRIDDAAKQLGKMRGDHPHDPEDYFRITCYLTPLSQDNESLRLAR